jgi:glycosyltransferase involved in cell wall biosynthesis
MACVRLVRLLPRSDIVSIHTSDRGTLFAAPLFFIVGRLLCKPIVFRQFGGSFERTFRDAPAIIQWIVRLTVFRSDVVLFQSRSLVHQLAPLTRRRPRWFPTARSIAKTYYPAPTREAGELRCVFLGHVRRAKGVREAVAAVARVAGVTLDLYGPLVDLDLKDLVGGRIRYKGEIEHSEVSGVLARYDLMIFPTRYEGEGYPGVLIEAAAVGLPILVTRWQAIPEMFGETEALWLDTGSAEEIADVLRAIVSAEIDLHKLSVAVHAASARFDVDRVYLRFLRTCRALAGERQTNV